MYKLAPGSNPDPRVPAPGDVRTPTFSNYDINSFCESQTTNLTGKTSNNILTWRILALFVSSDDRTNFYESSILTAFTDHANRYRYNTEAFTNSLTATQIMHFWASWSVYIYIMHLGEHGPRPVPGDARTLNF